MCKDCAKKSLISHYLYLFLDILLVDFNHLLVDFNHFIVFSNYLKIDFKVINIGL